MYQRVARARAVKAFATIWVEDFRSETCRIDTLHKQLGGRERRTSECTKQDDLLKQFAISLFVKLKAPICIPLPSTSYLNNTAQGVTQIV